MVAKSRGAALVEWPSLHCRRCAASAAAPYASAASAVTAALARVPQAMGRQARPRIRPTPAQSERISRAGRWSGVGKRALVIEGGGMKSAYGNGVLSAFEE